MARLIGDVTGGVGGIVYSGVDHALVNAMPENFGRAVDERLDEEDRVEFVDVVLVNDRCVKAAKALRDARRELRLAAVKEPGKEPSAERSQDRNAHQQLLHELAGCFSAGFARQLSRRRGLKNRRQKMLEPPADSDPATDNREKRQNHQRSQHHPRALMRLAMAMRIMSVCVMPVRITVPMARGAMRVSRGRAPVVVSAKRHIHQPKHIK